jgi:hypothetical protein
MQNEQIKNSGENSVTIGLTEPKFDTDVMSENELGELYKKPIKEMSEIRHNLTDGEIVALALSLICHALMMNQVDPMDSMYEQLAVMIKGMTGKELTKKQFEMALIIGRLGLAITGITEKYAYQTTSCLKQQKTLKEVMTIARS